jgi:putative membrane protein
VQVISIHLTLYCSMKKIVLLFFAGLILSAIKPHDYFTWILEVFPAILGFLVLAFTYSRFKFTNLTYILILLHCCVLFIGGHYTYAKVPLFDWIKDEFHQTRNNYDKVGHFIQGFVPAFIVRELFIRQQVVKSKAWTAFLTVSVCVTISVLYEFLEWFVSVISGESGDSFLGTQGYIWDTQSDMLFAMIGAICMVILFAKWQDKEINKLQKQN